LRYLKTGIPNHLLIVGSRGSGKTLLVRYLMQRLIDGSRAQSFYVNCRHHNTSFKILAELLQLRPRGFALDELWAQFRDKFSGPAVVVLDEADLISEKDRNKDILYLLSRSEHPYMVILLSNNPHFHQQLDLSIQSTLQPEIVHFRNYDAEQVRAILDQRARLGLWMCGSSDLAKIAAMVVRLTNSDIRVGIKALYLNALEPEAGIEANFDRARHDIVTDLIRGLSDRNLTILQAATGVPDGHVKSVYALYRRLSNQIGDSPFSYVYFYSNLAYLQSIGLIILVSTKVRRSYTNRIQLLFDPQVLGPIWQARFG
jgi:cell division control protein 6